MTSAGRERTNLRAWTEPETDAEAKSVRRWAPRAALPILARYLALFALVLVAILIFGELIPKPFIGSCGFDCPPPDPREHETILERLF
jgi:hypothetical protein